MTLAVDHQILIEDAVKLRPFGVLTGLQNPERHRFQVFQGLNLNRQLLDGFRRRCGGGDPFFEFVNLLLAKFLKILQNILTRQSGGIQERCALPFNGHPRLGKFVFKALAAAFQRVVDRRRRRGQPALENLQGEADVMTFLCIRFGKPLNPVHFLTDIVGNGRVKSGFLKGKRVFDRIGPSFGKERPAIEFQQFFLGQAAHHICGIGIVNTVAETAFKPVTVQKRHEELKILFLTVVRRCRHQQQMAADSAQSLPGLIAFGVLNLTPGIGRRHPVGFVANDQIPFLGTSQFFLKRFIPRQYV